jgi:DNA polymerase III epsilon subunit-like protein
MNYLILDTETTGLIIKNNNKIPNFKDLDNYNNSRLIQLSYQIIDYNFNIILKRNFYINNNITINNSNIHGITNEFIINNGLNFNDIINIFYNDLKISNIIIAHNINFDINILKSELYRYNFHECLEEISLKKNLCSMIILKDIIKIKNKYNKYKWPKLNEIYYFLFNTYDIPGIHNAENDVNALVTCIKELKNRNIINILDL